MKVLVTTDAHLFRTPDNKIWCKSIYGYEFWTRYLEVFKEVRIAARLKDVPECEDNWLRVDGHGVEVYAIPFFQRPWGLIRNCIKINRAIKDVYKGCDAVIYRLPSPIGQIIFRRKNSIPTAVEVVFDPIATSTKTLKSKILNKIMALDLKRICRKVNGVSYVTSYIIQENFPSCAKLNGPSNRYFESYYSSINLDKSRFGKPKKFEGKTRFTIVHSNVAMNSTRKGELVLIEAIKIVRQKGYNVNAIFIGDGSMRQRFEDRVKALDLQKYVKFTGLLASSSDVREILDQSDLYVLPTQAEGLPRGIIEAMAVGLPCISSPVGGIPEILEEQYLADPNNPNDYAEKIIGLISNPKIMESVSIRNIEKAKLYTNDKLQSRRNEFYSKLLQLCT